MGCSREFAQLRRSARRLLGLIVDRRFGIAAWTPVYLLVPLVVARTIRRRDQLALAITLCAVGWAVALGSR